MQRRNIPTLTVALSQFASLARFSAKASGYSQLPIFSVPANFENLLEEEINKIIEQRIKEFVALLANVTLR